MLSGGDLDRGEVAKDFVGRREMPDAVLILDYLISPPRRRGCGWFVVRLGK